MTKQGNRQRLPCFVFVILPDPLLEILVQIFTGSPHLFDNLIHMSSGIPKHTGSPKRVAPHHMEVFK